MNIIFLGERRISQECLKKLLGKEYSSFFTIKAIVTNRSFYDGFLGAYPGMRGTLFISNDVINVGSILDAIRSMNIQVLISVQHNWILPAEILDAVNGYAFNLHNARLPDYKGYNSISHAILNGDSEFVSTIHWMDPKVDSGDIIVEGITTIDPGDTALSLYKRTVNTAAKTFDDFLGMLKIGSIPRKKMRNGGVFYKKSDLDRSKTLNGNEPHERLALVSRACYFPPSEPAYLLVNGVKIYLTPQEFHETSNSSVKPFYRSEWELGRA